MEKFQIPFVACATSAIVAGLLAVAPTAAHAATATDTMAVSATVQSACIVSANALAFGSYNPTSGTNLDATTTLSVTCTSGTSYTVGLSTGNGSGATVANRKLTNGANSLSYALYQDASRTTNWGNTAGTDTPASAVAGSSATSLTVYGRVASGQNVPAGTYTDSVTITVNY